MVENQSRYVLGFVFFLAIMFSGLRGVVGSDTAAYLYDYQFAGGIDGLKDLLFKYEPVYVVFLSIHKSIFDSESFYLLSVSAFQALLLYAVAKNSSDKYAFLICYFLVFYLNFHFNIARSAISSMLFLYALCGRSSKMKIVALVLAPLFHITIIPFYLLLMLRRRFFGVAVALSLFLAGLLLSSDLLFLLLGKYEYYREYTMVSGGNIPLSTIIYSVIILFSLYKLKKRSALFSATAYFFLVSLLFSSFFVIGYRFVITSSLFYFYYLIEELGRSKSNLRTVLLWIPIAIFFYAVVVGIIFETDQINERISQGEKLERALDSTYIPYRFYWEDGRVKN